jgi:hypothetical protein
MAYKQFRINLTPEQQRKMLRGLAVKISKEQLGVGPIVMLHSANYAKVAKAKSGVVLELSPGEILATGSYNDVFDDSMVLQGSGFFGDAWEGIKKVGKFLKDTGIASAALDVAEKVGSNVVGPEIASAARGLVKGVTGVGAAMPMQKKKPSKVRRTLKASGLYI